MRFNPRRWVSIGVLCTCPMLALAGNPHPACAPTDEVAAILGQFYEGGGEERAPALLEAIASHPHDVHLHRSYQDSSGGEDVLERYRTEAADHPDDPMALYLYGRLLDRGGDPAAEKPLLAALDIDPDYPWAHFGLAHFYEAVRKDPAKAQSHLAAAIDACPNSQVILRRLGDLPKAEVVRRAEAARSLLAESASPAIAPLIRAVWAAEFKVLPPAEHDAVRERMRADLVLLRGPRLVEDRSVLGALREGYAQVGDDAGLDWAVQETARRFPDDEEAKHAEFKRFAERHALVDPCDVAASRIFHRALAETSRRWVELWPRDPAVRLARLQGVAGSPDPASADVTAAVDGLLETAAARPSVVPGTPVTFRGAEALVERGLALDRVPALIDQGMAEIRARAADGDAPPDDSKRAAGGLAILVNARLQLGQVEAAREAFGELQRAVTLEASSRVLTPEQEAALRKGRAIDEVLRYQDALSCDTSDPAAAFRLIEPLDPELARGVAAQRAWIPPSPPGGRSFGEAKSFPLPDFDLQDLSGRTWRTSDLRGKVVLIHAWASVPAVYPMLPWLEELTQRIVDRQDFALLTVNTDENPGMGATMVRESGVTLPVVFSQDLVRKLHDGQVSLPCTWLVDRQGVVRLQDDGYGGDKDGWLTGVLRAIDELRAEPKPQP